MSNNNIFSNLIARLTGKASKSQPDIQQLRRTIAARKRFYLLIQKSLLQIKSYDQIFVIIVAMLIGLGVGYLSIGFRSLINALQVLFWGEGALSEIVRSMPIYMKMGIPALVGMAVALIVHTFAREAKGHGVPEVMDAVATKNGFMRARLVVVKAIASALSIASGFAVGREGPIIQIGSAFGSSVGQIFQVSKQRMNTFVGCGAAAGIAATFNAPIAGAIFASEIILSDFSLTALGPIIVASVFGTIVTRGVYGDFPAFAPPEFLMRSPFEIGFYVLLGLFVGLIGWAFVKTLYFTEDTFDNWKFPVALKALVGGMIVGGIAIFYPQIMGVGYDSMESVLQGELPIIITAVLILGKIIATSVSLGSGASGGIFAPSLFIGSMVGATAGGIFHYYFPDITASAGAYSLVGMAAMVAATTHAPITAIMIIFEMSGEYRIILPLMIATIVASMITTKLLDGNIYTIKLKRRGVDIQSGSDKNVLNHLQVQKLKQQIVEVIDDDAPLESLLERMSQSTHPVFYVTDGDGKLCGIVTQGIIRRFLNRFEVIPPETLTRDICNKSIPQITDDTLVHEALRLMQELDMFALPVMDKNGRMDGQIMRSDIYREYQDILIKTQLADNMAASMKYAQRDLHEKIEVLPGFFLVRIDIPSKFLNHTVFSLSVRTRYGLEVLLIRKKIGEGFKETVPNARTKMKIGDQLLIFGEKSKIDKFLA